MWSSSLRHSTLRRSLQQLPKLRALSSYQLTEAEQSFRDKGILDELGFVQFDTLHEMQVRACNVYAQKELFGTYSDETKKFEWMTFAEFGDAVDRCRAVLKDLGIKEYGKVAIISNNRWEWATIAAAAYSLNANLVPMYEAQLPSDWTYILNDSGATVLFCATQDIYDKVKEHVLPSTPLVTESLCLNAPVGEPHAFETIMMTYTSDMEQALVSPPSPEDLANLIYTSGTTGKPKGVELTHLNFSSNIKSAARTMVDNPREFIRPDDRSLAFLPWAHSYGQTCELWNAVCHGLSMGICRGIPRILEDLQLVKPSTLYAVPTLYKRIYDGVNNMMEAASPLRKRLMKSALEMGHQRVLAEAGERAPLGTLEKMQFNILNSLVLSKIRARFGGRLRNGFVGGAACPSEVTSFMDSIGIPVCEGYGLTETSPIISMNSPQYRKLGTVGRPIGGVTVYLIGEDGKEVPTGEVGEICCVGPNVMRGYYQNEEATKQVITTAPDGKSRMFHTGDLGRMGEDGFLAVTGRLKEQYKLENGKYIAPSPIEETIGLSRFINQVVVCGANRPYNVALIVPDWTVIRAELNLDETMTDDELSSNEKVNKLIDREIKLTCSKLKKFEIPQEFAFVAPFTAANEMLTPKMSIRRHKVIETYADVINHMYGNEQNTNGSADSRGAKENAGEEDQKVA